MTSARASIWLLVASLALPAHVQGAALMLSLTCDCESACALEHESSAADCAPACATACESACRSPDPLESRDPDRDAPRRCPVDRCPCHPANALTLILAPAGVQPQPELAADFTPLVRQVAPPSRSLVPPTPPPRCEA